MIRTDFLIPRPAATNPAAAWSRIIHTHNPGTPMQATLSNVEDQNTSRGNVINPITAIARAILNHRSALTILPISCAAPLLNVTAMLDL